MPCQHKFKTINTVSRKAFGDGSKKFRSGFEEGDSFGLKILSARRKECGLCGEKKTTVEIDKLQLDDIYEVLRDAKKTIEVQATELVLTKTEKKVRNFLIDVSKGKVDTQHQQKATYKEVWSEVYPDRPFGRGNANEVVFWIVNVSNYDTRNKRPPLNSLVVRGDTAMPGESWEEWLISSEAKYKSVEQAQQACWKYWS